MIPLSIVLFACSGPGESPAPAQAATPSCSGCNVVWITMDTTRADRMGFLGSTAKLTPNLDKLAAKGTAWAHAYSQAPETSLSVSSFFAGRYRHNLGMDFYVIEADRTHAMAPSVTTVAEVLKGQGYRATGFTANPLISKSFNLDLHQGFDGWNSTDDPGLVTNGIRVWDEATKAKKPLFLYLQWFGPHTDNERQPGFEDRRGTFTTQLTTITEKTYQDANHGRLALTDQDLAYIRAMYDDGIWAMDAQIGQLLDHIQRSPEATKTIFVITADHGEGLNNPGSPNWLGHEKYLGDELLRVPLLIVAPGVQAGTVNQERVAELVDLAPTITGLLGLKQAPEWEWDGESLFGADPKLAAISERGKWEEREVSARTPEASLIKAPVSGDIKRYDLKKDPHQASPVAGGGAWDALQARIDGYLGAIHAPKDNPAPVAGTDQTDAMLKSLGYKE